MWLMIISKSILNFTNPERKGGLTQILRQLREFIDMLAGITAVWNTEAEVKVKALQQVISEVVPLNHTEVD